jgi:hypothetical protein
LFPIDTKRPGKPLEGVCVAAEVQRHVVRQASMNEAVETLRNFAPIDFNQQAVAGNREAFPEPFVFWLLMVASRESRLSLVAKEGHKTEVHVQLLVAMK